MSTKGNRLYEFGDFRLDASARLLSRRGVTCALTPKAIDVLLALVEQRGQLLDKETLLKKVWPDSFVEENNLADNIFKLRRVLEDGENGPRFIETVPRRGYRFVADVRTADPPTEQTPAPKESVPAQLQDEAQGLEHGASVPATQVSLGGGSGPRWRADGKELYYQSLDRNVMAVSVTTADATLTTGPPRALFAFRAAGTSTIPSYAVTRGGERFLLSATVENDPKAPLSVVQNWTAVFRR